jgi:hypothetical protein
MKIAGIAGAIAPSILAKAGTLCRNGATAGSTPSAETVADRTLNYPSGSESQPMRAGRAFRFGFGLKQVSVPADTSIGQTHSPAGALSMQFDGINRWPDGSVRWSEMRGLHGRGIPHTGR